MKFSTRTLTLILCGLMLTVSLASCKAPRTPDLTEETGEGGEGTAAIELPEGCSWAVEPGIYDGDIRTMYDLWTSSVYRSEISLLSNEEGSFLIDQEGNVKTVLNSPDFNYCSWDECNVITNHLNTVVPADTLTAEDKCTEHGGVGRSVYVYDKDSGGLYYEYPDKYVPAVAEYAIAEISTKTPLTQEEASYYSTGYRFRATDGYGIVKDNELIISGFDMYSGLSCGVAAFSKDGKWGYYDKNGNEIFPCVYEAHYFTYLDADYNARAVPFEATEGIIVLTLNGRSAYATVEGEMLTDFIFDKANPVFNNKAWVKTADGWGVVEFEYEYVNTDEETDFSANAANTVHEHQSTDPSLPYTWVVEPMAVEGDIRPLYDMLFDDIVSSKVCVVENEKGESLIGYDGRIKAEIPSDGLAYCAVCDSVTNHNYFIDIDNNYKITEKYIGHGGGVCTPYIYDKETGEFFSLTRGKYFKENDVEYAIVSVSVKRDLTAKEKETILHYEDFIYESTDGYGVVVNGELVLSGFDMYSLYSCGVIALRSNGKWGYYDTKGKEIFPCVYDSSEMTIHIANTLNTTTVPYSATDGVIVLNKGGKWAFADTEGNMLTDFEFDEALPVYKGKAWVKTADGWGVIVLNYSYTEDENISESDSDSYNSYTV